MIAATDLPAPARLVALSISNHKHSSGSRPSTGTIASETGLGERTVRTHLQAAMAYVFGDDGKDRATRAASVEPSKTAPVWARILYSTLPWPSKLVVEALVDHCGRSGCYPKMATIARETGLSKRTVLTHLAELAQQGVITITPGGLSVGNANYYTIDVAAIDRLVRPKPAASPAPLAAAPAWGAAAPAPGSGLSCVDKEGSPDESSPEKVTHESPLPPGGHGNDLVVSVQAEDDEVPGVDASGQTAKSRFDKPISEWNNREVALEFEAQAARFCPKLSGRCNLAAVAKALKEDRAKTGATAELHVAMVDAFFWDLRYLTDGIALWRQFIAAFPRLTHRAEQTLLYDRDDRQGHPEGESYRPSKKWDAWEERNKYLIANGLEPLGRDFFKDLADENRWNIKFGIPAVSEDEWVERWISKQVVDAAKRAAEAKAEAARVAQAHLDTMRPKGDVTFQATVIERGYSSGYPCLLVRADAGWQVRLLASDRQWGGKPSVSDVVEVTAYLEPDIDLVQHFEGRLVPGAQSSATPLLALSATLAS
ncbi:hypothetical protein acdb102_31050 [Acidothermaceae bacterium B102]|nr:hypothetical protein acdb102_31050 [Acidothermaceae bacterium B102]